MSAEYATGQILFTIRNSNLHYLTKETHQSVYITIRKKLIKPDEKQNASVTEDNAINNVKKIDENGKWFA